MSYLDRYLSGRVIKDQVELFELVNSVKRGKRHLCLGIRVLLNFYETFNMIDDESLMKYRKVLKIPGTRVDEYVPDDEKIISTYEKIEDERYRILYKLLAFSGLRFIEAIYLLNEYDKNKLIIKGDIAKYPLSLKRRTKRSFYAYMPREFALELRRMDIDEKASERYISRRGLPAKYLRKWNYNFLILNGVPESVADFIQGRAPSTIGSMHYLARVKQADEWYSRIVKKLASLFK